MLADLEYKKRATEQTFKETASFLDRLNDSMDVFAMRFELRSLKTLLKWCIDKKSSLIPGVNSFDRADMFNYLSNCILSGNLT